LIENGAVESRRRFHRAKTKVHDILQPSPAKAASVSPEASVTDKVQAERNIIWRFYTAHGVWRWQQLLSDRAILCDCREPYATYEDCVADAEAHGYKHLPAQEKVARPFRSYEHLWR
jgi:hypothetical protein